MNQQNLKFLLIAAPQAAASPALKHAIRLADAMNASLQIVSFVHSERVDIVGSVDHNARDKARDSLMNVHRQWLRSETSALRHKDVKVEIDIVWERASAQSMATYIDRRKVDLVIKDLHEESTLKRLVLSSLDWDVLRASSTSILFVKDIPDRKPLKFLAAVEFGLPCAADTAQRNRIINTARNISGPCNAAFHLISVYDRSELDGSFLSEALGIDEVPTFDARKLLFDECAEIHEVAREHRHFIVGHPAHAIRDYIERCGFDLLVLGTVAKDAPLQAIGHTAKCILGDPPCSVLVLKPFAMTGNLHVSTLRGIEVGGYASTTYA